MSSNHPQEGEAPPSTRGYLLVGGLMLALTLAAFFAVTTHGLVRAILVPSLLVLAAVQVALQVVLFMHLNVSRRVFAGFFAAGAGLAIVIAGSVLAILTDTQKNAPVMAATTMVAPSTTPAPSAPAPAKTSSTPATHKAPSTHKTPVPSKPTSSTPPAKVSTQPKPSSHTASSSVSPAVIKAAVQIVSARCLVCHTIAGLQPQGTIGPDLNQVMAGKINLVPGGQPTNPAWLAKWLADPPKVWSGAIMPDLGLTSSQVKTLIAYLGTLH